MSLTFSKNLLSAIMNKFHNLSGEKSSQRLLLTDAKGLIIGTASREECHYGYGKPHLAFMAFILNKNNEILLTQRSSQKSLWPLYWDASTISHVLAGETVEKAANRRGKEELGMDVIFADLGAFYYREKYEKNSENEYCHVLIGISDISPNLNPVEINAVKKVSFSDLLRDINQHQDKYTPWLKLALKDQKISVKFLEYFR